MDTDLIMSWWEHLRLVWAGAGLILVLVTGVVVWRVRGLLNWKRSQRRELAELRQLMDTVDGEQHRALAEVIAACEDVWQASSPDFDKFRLLPDYWRRIAACYFPEEPQPELCLSIDQLLVTAQRLAGKLEALLQRPGFEILGRLRIRQLRYTFDWYRQFNANPVVAWLVARRKSLRLFWHTMRFVLPDPLAWMAYLSQRLTVMMAGRSLLMDVYLFTGKCAMDAYDAQRHSVAAQPDAGASEKVLDAFETMLDDEARPGSPQLQTLRRSLTGMPARLWRPPGIGEWWQAVEEAAAVIAAGYFPESRAPLEEATCRVLLDRSRYWLEAMAAARRMPVVRPLYRVSLKQLMQIKTMSESDLLQRTGKVAAGAWAAWRWAQWPVKVFRWIRRRSPAGVAVEVGFTLARKALINYLARYGFDRACRELDGVYRLSCKSRPDPQPGEDPVSEDPASEDQPSMH